MKGRILMVGGMLLALLIDGTDALAARALWLCGGDGRPHATPQKQAGCQPLDAAALGRAASAGDEAAVRALLATMVTPMLLMPEKMRALKALDFPAGRRPSEPTLRRMEATFADPRLPFRAAIGLAAFMQRFEPLPPPDAALEPGLRYRLRRSETCRVGARLLASGGDAGVRTLWRAWASLRQSSEVQECLAFELEPYLEMLLPEIESSYARTEDAQMRVQLVNWMGQIGAAALPALERAAANDPDNIVRRIAQSYIDKLR
ncbi:MAG: hypothetical protein R8K47_02605 [Mariprofundaceae bacterium]